ncbi:MAG: hypothetical protein H8K10_17420 [Nitrospira sp.]|nr:hypothetical protein [Nitrospira sp.]
MEEQLAGVAPTSQLGRALRDLGVELIAAHSPQAKGRTLSYLARSAGEGDAHGRHRPLPVGTDVRAVLALRTRRVFRRDRTVAHGGQLYQVQDRVRATHVVVEERVDGTLCLLHGDRRLTY